MWIKRFLFLFRFPLLTLLLLFSLAGGSLLYTIQNLKIDTDTTKLFSEELPFIKLRKQFEQRFPQDKDVIVILIESPFPEISEKAALRLYHLLETQQGKHLKDPHLPFLDPFFLKNGLLYLEREQLEELVKALSQAQPFITTLYKDFSLEGLLRLLEKLFEYDERLEVPIEVDRLFSALAETVEATLEGRPYLLSWQKLFFDASEGAGTTLQLLTVSPILDYSKMLPAEEALSAIHQAAEAVKVVDGVPVEIALTGEPVMEHEELLALERGMAFASLLSLLLVVLALIWGLRSLSLIVAALLTLLIGLAFSFGFATVALGALNLISIAFAVLYIGMGVDYATHFALRYRELLTAGKPRREALLETLRDLTPTLGLCALTTALAMFAFLPTDYRGVAELGLIAGSSIVIVFLTTLIAMPALLKLLPFKQPRPVPSQFLSAPIAELPYRYQRAIRGAALVLTLAALGLVCSLPIDPNPINLRPQESESVRAFKRLVASDVTSPFFLTSLARSASEVRRLDGEFEKLPEVSYAISIFDLIPERQEEKLFLLEEMALLLGPQLEQELKLESHPPNLQAIERFTEKLKVSEKFAHRELITALEELIQRCRELQETGCRKLLASLQFRTLATFPQTMRRLKMGIETEGVDLESFPETFKRRWISPDGFYRLDVYASLDLNRIENLSRFVEAAKAVDPDVIGLPRVYVESMAVVVGAFKQAFSSAVGVIALLLLLLTRKLQVTVLVLMPQLLGALFTAAAMVLLSLPLNFANVIALPLIFGLGVNNGVHMVHRIRQVGSRVVLTTATARGIFFSVLTTLCSFISLALLDHPGVASLGQLLTLGLTLTLLCSFIMLPPFAAKWLRR